MKYNSSGFSYWNITDLHINEELRPAGILCHSDDNCYILEEEVDDDFTLTKYNLSGIPTVISKTNYTEKKTYAVVIGVRDYPGVGNDLQYSTWDSQAMAQYLRNLGNIPAENIRYITDSNATESYLDSVLAEIESKILPTDDLVFTFSGHGSSRNIELYDAVYSPSDAWTHFYPIQCNKKYTITDACGGGFGSGELNYYSISSCAEDEICYETPQFAQGVFTEYFLESTLSETDLNGDGIFTLEDQYLYLYDRVVSWSYGDSHPGQSSGIVGPAAIWPCIANSVFNQTETGLAYTFEMLGSGQICSLSMDITVQSDTTVVNIIQKNSTSNGFGVYTGTEPLTVAPDETFTIDINFEVLGNRYQRFSYSFSISPPQDPPPDDSNIIIIIIIISVVLSAVGISSVGYLLKRRASSEDFGF